MGVQVPVGARSADCGAKALGCGQCCCLSSKGKVALACPKDEKRSNLQAFAHK